MTTTSHAPEPPGSDPALDVLGGNDGLVSMAMRMAEALEQVPIGPWRPDSTHALAGMRLGGLVVSGLLLRNVPIGDFSAASLVLPGEPVDLRYLAAPDAYAEPVTWTAVEPTVVIGLGDRFLDTACSRPALLLELHRVQAEYANRLARHAAMTQLPRVEQRILALFCALAEDRGRVGRDGILLEADFTHETIGRLVGARRPSVSLALKALANEGLLARQRGGAWLIGRDAEGASPRLGT